MTQQKHKRGLTCSKCGGNLKTLLHYNSFGTIVRAKELFYCSACEIVVKVVQTEVKL